MARLFDATTDWPEVLDALQAHVECAEHLLERDPARPVPAWEPPAGAANLPVDQVARAAELLDRLNSLIRAQERAAASVHHEMAFVRSASATGPAPRPQYLDACL
jgi:hypothetical protein